jgi:CBS-domain-containing membrane protein
MRVEEIMTKHVSVCTAGTNAAKAAELMWIHDSGVLPVVDDSDRRLVGIVTDRDLFIALGTKGQSCRSPKHGRRDLSGVPVPLQSVIRIDSCLG